MEPLRVYSATHILGSLVRHLYLRTGIELSGHHGIVRWTNVRFWFHRQYLNRRLYRKLHGQPYRMGLGFWRLQFIDDSRSYALAGTYNACLTASSICDFATQCRAVTVLNTGIESSTSLTGLSLGSEGNGMFSANLSAFDGQKVQVHVFDSRGRMVHTNNNVGVTNRSTYQLNLTTLPSGLYLVQFTSGALSAMEALR
jgi:hypothetical protein